MNKIFTCEKDHCTMLRKRCPERQEINRDDFKRKSLAKREIYFPHCTDECEQGQSIVKELGV